MQPNEITAKDLRVAPIGSREANDLMRKLHYSHKVVVNSQLHLGVFLGTRLEGAMQFGPSLDRRKLLPLVAGTQWNGFLDLNRLAFSDNLPRNSESRALGVALRLIRKTYRQIEWIVSFADATQCGDGTIYRAAGFLLTRIKRNTTLWQGPDGEIISNIGERTSMKKIQAIAGKTTYKGGADMDHYKRAGFKPLPGFQLRYLYFTNPEARKRLTVPVLPYSAIARANARMIRGQRVGSIPAETAADPAEEGGSTPTPTLPTIYIATISQ
jgi:hypothetical protein